MSAAVEAAAKAIFDIEYDHRYISHREMCHKHARAALTAARPHLTEGLAEVIAKAHYDWSQQRLQFWRNPRNVDAPGDVDEFVATAITEELKRRIEG